MPKYQAREGQQLHDVSAEELANLDLQGVENGSYHLLLNNKAYHIDGVSIDRVGKRVKLRINGREKQYDLLDETDQAIDALGFTATEKVIDKNINAPMPGLVLEILVEEGQEITAGTAMIILEAMKMENVLKAEGDGIVNTVEVEQGQAVEKRQLLISID